MRLERDYYRNLQIKTSKGRFHKEKSKILWFLLPTFLVMTLVVAYPLIFEFVLSFKRVVLQNLRSWDWPNVGFDNYKRIFREPIFYKVLGNTVLWTVINVSCHVFFGMGLALLLNRKLPFKALIRLILILPWAMPEYIVALTWKGLFNEEFGTINVVLKTLFGSDAMIPWLSDPKYVFIASIITNVWLGIPFIMMVCLGGLQSIDKEYYEAAEVDGASNWQKLKNITLPLLKPVMTPAIILGTVWTFNKVNIIYIMAGNNVSDDAHILVTYAMKKAFNNYNYSYSAAFAVIIFLILALFSSTFIKAQKMNQVR
ncbi:MAG TPA: sugar ABC transporter permease [Clostridium sp.]|jgi:arabinogalactan oligomer/maltooligosaccharide transport system permease protein|nr:sugar ABC transporter permease [Clostridia bacterium]HCW03242.1 sugar ABC transporter permease [Clostridium sp.]